MNQPNAFEHHVARIRRAAGLPFNTRTAHTAKHRTPPPFSSQRMRGYKAGNSNNRGINFPIPASPETQQPSSNILTKVKTISRHPISTRKFRNYSRGSATTGRKASENMETCHRHPAGISRPKICKRRRQLRRQVLVTQNHERFGWTTSDPDNLLRRMLRRSCNPLLDG